ncbi:Uncharacterised protein [Streptococcus pneumoniae]|nr:Uncharacterised protein [Streptococcus pneumoniae]
MDNRPIGFLDSGVGGLTVVVLNELTDSLIECQLPLS